MNDLMSAGIHRLWKNKMIEEINFSSEEIKFIDVAGGTGDIAFRIAKKAKSLNKKYQIDVVDINQEMLDVGKERAVNFNLFSNLKFTCADGEQLPFENETFDFFTIAFGIRNFTNIDAGISEAKRVLKNGGKFICLEFSKVNNYFLQKIYDSYSFNVIPKIGKMVLNDKNSYQYLVESIRKFPSQEKFASMLKDIGFSKVEYKNLTFGTAAIHIAEK